MVRILQFWVCVMVHMEAVDKSITERDIDCLEHLTGVTCPYFEDGSLLISIPTNTLRMDY